jgi:hypothetical protein
MKNIDIKDIPVLLRNVDYLNNHFYNLKEKLNNPYLKILHNILEQYTKKELEQEFRSPEHKAIKFDVYNKILNTSKLETLFKIILDKKIKEEKWHPFIQYINEHQKNKTPELISYLYDLQKDYENNKDYDFFFSRSLEEIDINIGLNYFQQKKEDILLLKLIMKINEEKFKGYIQAIKEKENHLLDIGLEKFINEHHLTNEKLLPKVLHLLEEGFQLKEKEESFKNINLILLNNLNRNSHKKITTEILLNIDYNRLELYSHYQNLMEYIENNPSMKELKINLNYQKINKEINNSLNASIIRKKI